MCKHSLGKASDLLLGVLLDNFTNTSKSNHRTIMLPRTSKWPQSWSIKPSNLAPYRVTSRHSRDLLIGRRWLRRCNWWVALAEEVRWLSGKLPAPGPGPFSPGVQSNRLWATHNFKVTSLSKTSFQGDSAPLGSGVKVFLIHPRKLLNCLVEQIYRTVFTTLYRTTVFRT